MRNVKGFLVLVSGLLLTLPAWSESPMRPGGMGPGGMFGRSGMRPPRMAMEACEDKSAEAACSFMGRSGQTISGTCFRPDEDKPLLCKPEGLPMPGKGPKAGGKPLGIKAPSATKKTGP